MSHTYSTLDASDVEQDEALRQSELVSRLTNRIEGDLYSGGPIVGTVSRTISQWLLDNDLRITRR